MRKFFIICYLFFSAIGFYSCSGCTQTEGVTAEITAAQMEGRSDARKFINSEYKDTFQLQKDLLEAKAKRSKYLLNQKPECAEAYDSAFRSTIRTVRPDISAAIENYQNN